MKNIHHVFSVGSLILSIVCFTPAMAAPKNQGYNSSCGGASGYNNSSIDNKSSKPSVGGRHNVGTAVGVCVGGIHVGSSTQIQVDMNGSSVNSSSTRADCIGSRKSANYGVYSGSRGDNNVSTYNSAGASCK